MSILVNAFKNILNKNQQANFATSSKLSMDVRVSRSEGGSIICFTAGSEGDALAHLTHAAIAPLASRAARVAVINVMDPNWLIKLQEILQEPVWFVYSYFGVGQALEVVIEGVKKNIWEFFDVPFVRVYGDSPAYFPDKHVGIYRNSVNLYGYASHVEFYRRWFHDRALTLKCPSIPLDVEPLANIDIEKKARGVIIFPKNGNSVNALLTYWEQCLPQTVAKALGAISEECSSKVNIDSDIKIDDYIMEYFEQLGIKIEDARPVLCFLVAQIDDYLRRYKSTMIAEAILDLPIQVRGVNWGHVNFTGRRATLFSISDYSTTRALMPGVMAIIDMSPNVGDSPHDRICRAAGSGTAFLTNRQKFVDNIAADPTGMVFDFNKKSIRDLVEYRLLNARETAEMGLEQARSFREHYTEQSYVDCMLAAVQTMSMRLGARPLQTQNFVDFPPKIFT